MAGNGYYKRILNITYQFGLLMADGELDNQSDQHPNSNSAFLYPLNR
jgi:hypothetical protein